MTLIEQIARQFHIKERTLIKVINEMSPINCSWEELPKGFSDLYLNSAAQLITDLKLVQLDENQSMTDASTFTPSWREAQQDMLNNNFRKIKQQGEK